MLESELDNGLWTGYKYLVDFVQRFDTHNLSGSDNVGAAAAITSGSTSETSLSRAWEESIKDSLPRCLAAKG